MQLIIDEVIEGVDFSSTAFALRKLENSRFVNCNFEGSNLSDFRF